MNDYEWINDLVGRPWAEVPEPPASYNCGELLRYIYRTRLGIASPPIMVNSNDLRQVCLAVRDLQAFGNFRLVDVPADYDIVELYRGSEPDHVGMYFGANGGGVLHCQRNTGVVFDRVFALRALGWRSISFNRHADMEVRRG